MASDLPPAYSQLAEASLNPNNDPEAVVSIAGTSVEPLIENKEDKLVCLGIKEEAMVVVALNDDRDPKLLIESTFEDEENRIGFIQKVLAITLLQMMIVTICLACFTSFRHRLPLGGLILFNNFIAPTAIAYMITLGLLVFCDKARWKKPYKYIFLVMYPLTYGLFLSIACFFHYFDDALVPVLTTWAYFCAVILALLLYSIYATQTKIKFTVEIGHYIVVGLLVFMYTSTAPFLQRVNPFHILYPTLVVFLLCSYILNDIHAMVSKDYRFVVTPADFVTGALNVHIDYGYMIKRGYNCMTSS